MYFETSNNALEALTPNQFLMGSHTGSKAIGNILRHEWKRKQLVSSIVYKRFVAKDLSDIFQRTKSYDPVKPLRVGDVVTTANADELRDVNIVEGQKPHNHKTESREKKPR